MHAESSGAATRSVNSGSLFLRTFGSTAQRASDCTKGEQTAEDGSAATVTTELFAALSLEEGIAYVRRRQQNAEILELKVLGKVQMLFSSEHLA